MTITLTPEIIVYALMIVVSVVFVFFFIFLISVWKHKNKLKEKMRNYPRATGQVNYKRATD